MRCGAEDAAGSAGVRLAYGGDQDAGEAATVARVQNTETEMPLDFSGERKLRNGMKVVVRAAHCSLYDRRWYAFTGDEDGDSVLVYWDKDGNYIPTGVEQNPRDYDLISISERAG